MKVYFHLRFVFEKVFVTANFTMDLNTATFEEMQSLAGSGHGRAHAIFDGRAVNGLSVAIDNVNMRQAHFESVLKAGGRIAGPKVECGELNTKPMAMASNKMSDAGSQTDILGDSE